MKIIEQYFEIQDEGESHVVTMKRFAKRIERCGRVAYKSEDKITEDSYEPFIYMLRKRKHLSVLEHSLMTVIFVTDRGVSHELVRHRVASYTQESTRYCNYTDDKFDGQLTFILPVWMNKIMLDGKYFSNRDTADNVWLESMMGAETQYNRLINLGWRPEQARDVLPISLKTEIVASMNYREWLHVFDERLFNKAAHPQMRALMRPLYDYCRITLPCVFDCGNPDIDCK